MNDTKTAMDQNSEVESVPEKCKTLEDQDDLSEGSQPEKSEEFVPKEKQNEIESDIAPLNDHEVCTGVESVSQIDDLNQNQSPEKLSEVSQDSVINRSEESMDVVQSEGLDSRKTVIKDSDLQSLYLDVERQNVNVENDISVLGESDSYCKDMNPVASMDASESTQIDDESHAEHMEDVSTHTNSYGNKRQDLQAIQPAVGENAMAAAPSEENSAAKSSEGSHTQKYKPNEREGEHAGEVSASLEDESKNNSGDENSLVIDESTPSSVPPEPPSGSGSETSTPGGAKQRGKVTRTPRSAAPIDKDLLELLRLPEKYGWKRELVYRGISETSKVKADVYYHPPSGKKLRSMMDISTYLSKIDKSPLRPTHFSFRKEKLFEPPFEIARQANAPKGCFGMGKAAKDKEAPKSSPKPKPRPKEAPVTLGKRPIKRPSNMTTQWAPAGIKFTASKQSIKNAQNTLRTFQQGSKPLGTQAKYIVTRVMKNPGEAMTRQIVNPSGLSRTPVQSNSDPSRANVPVHSGKPMWKVRLAPQGFGLKKKLQRKPSPVWRPSDSDSGSESDTAAEGSGERQTVEIIRDGLGVASSETDEMTRLMGQPSDLIASIVRQTKTPQQREADECEVNRAMGSASDLIASIVRQSKPIEQQQGQSCPTTTPNMGDARSIGPYITKRAPSVTMSQLLPLPRLTRPNVSAFPQTGAQPRFEPRIIILPPNQYNSIVAGASSGTHSLPLTLVSTPPMLTRPITLRPGTILGPDSPIAPFARPPPLLRPAIYQGPPNLTPGLPAAMKAPPPLIHAAVRGPPALQPCPSLFQQPSPNQHQQTPQTAPPHLNSSVMLNQPNASVPSSSEPSKSSGQTQPALISDIADNSNEGEKDMAFAGNERQVFVGQMNPENTPANSEVVVSDSSDEESGVVATDTANGPLHKKRPAVCVVSSSEEESESGQPSKRIRLDRVENKKPEQAAGKSLNAVQKLIAKRSEKLLGSEDGKENRKISNPDRTPESIDCVSSDNSEDDHDVSSRKSHQGNGNSEHAVEKLVNKWSGRLSESLHKEKITTISNGSESIDNDILSDNSEDEDEFLPPVSFAPPDTGPSKSPSHQDETEIVQSFSTTDLEHSPSTAAGSSKLHSDSVSVSNSKSEVENKNSAETILSGSSNCPQQLLTLPSHLRGKLDLSKALALSINGQQDVIIRPSHVLDTKESLKVLLPPGVKLPQSGPGQILNVAVSNVKSLSQRRKTCMRDFRSSFRLLQESLTIMTKILKFFTLPEILRLSLVNRTWMKMCYQPDLWKAISMKGVYVTDWSMAKNFFLRVGVKKLNLSGMVLRRDIEQQSWQHIKTLVSELKSLSELKFGRVPSNIIEGLMEKLPCSVNMSAEYILDTNPRGSRSEPFRGGRIEKNVENMSMALASVQSGMSASNAAKKFNVSESDLVHLRHDREIELTPEEKDKVILCCMRLARLGFNITLSSFMVKCQEMFARRYETSVPFPIFDSVCREMYHHNKSFFNPNLNLSIGAKLDQHYENLSNLYNSLSRLQKIEADQVFMFDMQTIRISVDENDAQRLFNKGGKRKINHALATLLWSSNASSKKLKSALLVTPLETTLNSALTGTPFETSFNANSKSKLVVMMEKSGIATRSNVQQYLRQLINSVVHSPAVILCSEDSLYFSESLVSMCLAHNVFLFNVHSDIAKLAFPGRHGGLLKLIDDGPPLPSIQQLALRVETLLTKDLSRLKTSTSCAFKSSGAFPVNRNAPNQYRPFARGINVGPTANQSTPAAKLLETPEFLEDSNDNDSVISRGSKTSNGSSTEKSGEESNKEELEKVSDATHSTLNVGKENKGKENVTHLRLSRLMTSGPVPQEANSNRLLWQTLLEDKDKVKDKFEDNKLVKRSKTLIFYRQVLKKVLRGPKKIGSYKYKPLKPLNPLKPIKVVKTVIGSSVVSTLSFRNMPMSAQTIAKEAKDGASGPTATWSLHRPSKREDTASPKLVIDETDSADMREKAEGSEKMGTKKIVTSVSLTREGSEKQKDRGIVSKHIQEAIEAVVEASREYARQVERGGVHGEEIMPEKWILRHGGKSNAAKGSQALLANATRGMMKLSGTAEEMKEVEEKVSDGKDKDIASEEEETIGKDEDDHEVEKEEEDGDDAAVDSSDNEKEEADEWIVSSRPKQETESVKDKHQEKKKRKKKRKNQGKSGDEEELSDSSGEKKHRKKKSKKRKKKKKKADKLKKKHRPKFDDPNISVCEEEMENLEENEVNVEDNKTGSSNQAEVALTSGGDGTLECQDTRPSYVADHDYFSKFVDEDAADGEKKQEVSKDLIGSNPVTEACETPKETDLELCRQNREGKHTVATMESDASNISSMKTEEKDDSKSSNDNASSSSSDSDSNDNNDSDGSSSKDSSDTNSAGSEDEEAGSDSSSEEEDSQQKDVEASSSSNSSSNEDSSAESESSDDETKQEKSGASAGDSSGEDEEEAEEDKCQLCMRSTPPHSQDVIIDWVDCDKNCGRWFHVICIKNSKFRPKSKSKNIKHYVCPSCRD